MYERLRQAGRVVGIGQCPPEQIELVTISVRDARLDVAQPTPGRTQLIGRCAFGVVVQRTRWTVRGAGQPRHPVEPSDERTQGHDRVTRGPV